MIATLPMTMTLNGRNLSGSKEQVGSFQVVSFNGTTFETPINARLWMSRSPNASVVYASIWTGYHAGHGKAGGYGYHKESAAIAAAIESAGIVLSEDISGRGEGAIKDALAAIATARGYSTFTIVTG